LRVNDFLYSIFRYTYEQECQKATDKVTMNGRGEASYYLDLQWAQAVSIQYNYVDKITKEAM